MYKCKFGSEEFNILLMEEPQIFDEITCHKGNFIIMGIEGDYLDQILILDSIEYSTFVLGKPQGYHGL